MNGDDLTATRGGREQMKKKWNGGERVRKQEKGHDGEKDGKCERARKSS